MAKEAAPEGEDGEKPEGEAAPEPKKGLKRFLTKKILMIVVPVAVLAVAAIMAISARARLKRMVALLSGKDNSE